MSVFCRTVVAALATIALVAIFVAGFMVGRCGGCCAQPLPMTAPDETNPLLDSTVKTQSDRRYQIVTRNGRVLELWDHVEHRICARGGTGANLRWQCSPGPAESVAN